MKVTHREKNVLLENEHGSYHFSHERFEELGEEAAIKYAEKEIQKKSKEYLDTDIDFQRARDIGFCKEGLEDFCEQTGLDINGTYKLSDIKEKITLDLIKEYPKELVKLFGHGTFDNWGGLVNFIEETGYYEVAFNEKFMTKKRMHLLACDLAEAALIEHEKTNPRREEPWKAIELKRIWTNERSEDEL